MKSQYFIAIILVFTVLSACASFVKLDPGAERIRVITIEQASKCTQAGKVFVDVLSKVGSIKRDSDRIGEDAQNMARNQALGFDANAIAPWNEISAEGKQIYGIYDCE